MNVRYAIRIWRKETDIYINNIIMNVKLNQTSLKQTQNKIISKIRIINERSIIRNTSTAFHEWKLITQVDKKAENKKLQTFFLNNAKKEVHKSQLILSNLY